VSWQKLQQDGLQHENVLVEVIHSVPFFACTCTKPGLTSDDDSWVGGSGWDGQIDNEH